MIIKNEVAHKIIKAMCSCLEDKPSRDYGRFVSVKNGEAVMTDGFCLCKYVNPNIEIEEKHIILNKNGFPVSVKFPNYENIFPTAIPERIDDKETLKNWESILKGVKTSLKNVFVAIEYGRVVLTGKPYPGCPAIDPLPLQKYLKAVPKGMELQELAHYKESEAITAKYGTEGIQDYFLFFMITAKEADK